MVANFIDRDGHLHCRTMEGKYGPPFCSWVQSRTGKSYTSIFFSAIFCNTTVCWHPEILLPWQRGNDVFCLFYSSFWLLSRTQTSHCLVNWSSRFQTKNAREIWLRYSLWGKFSKETIKKNYSFYTQRNKSFLI